MVFMWVNCQMNKRLPETYCLFNKCIITAYISEEIKQRGPYEETGQPGTEKGGSLFVGTRRIQRQ